MSDEYLKRTFANRKDAYKFASSVVGYVEGPFYDFDLNTEYIVYYKDARKELENGVVVIKHWRMHNLLRKDRYSPTQYQEQKEELLLKENGAYTEKVEIPALSEPDNHLATTWQPNDNQMATIVILHKRCSFVLSYFNKNIFFLE